MKAREKSFRDVRKDHGLATATLYKLQKSLKRLEDDDEVDRLQVRKQWRTVMPMLKKGQIGRAISYDARQTDKRSLIGKVAIIGVLYAVASLYTGELHPGAIVYKISEKLKSDNAQVRHVEPGNLERE